MPISGTMPQTIPILAQPVATTNSQSPASANDCAFAGETDWNGRGTIVKLAALIYVPIHLTSMHR